MTPRIGIMMPAYNAEKWIGQAIQSIQNQTHQDWILQIVDDGSTDHTIEAVRPYLDDERVHLGAQIHTGCPGARNKCLELLLRDPDVEYVGWLDSDDVCDPQRLELELGHLETHPEIDIVRSSYNWIDLEGKVIKSMMPRPANASMLVRRKWFDNYKIPDGQWHGSDGRWIDIVTAAGAQLATLQCELYSQRRHPEQISLRKRKAH